ncbi:hypothetical protein P7K49_014262, partial [Saguinus oedipus]
SHWHDTSATLHTAKAQAAPPFKKRSLGQTQRQMTCSSPHLSRSLGLMVRRQVHWNPVLWPKVAVLQTVDEHLL